MKPWITDDTFLGRWLEGTLTAEEKRLFEADPEYPTYVKMRDDLGRLRAPSVDKASLFDKIKESKSAPKPKVVRLQRRQVLLGIAAAALLFVVGYVALFPQITTVNTSAGVIEEVSLPDGSVVVLNGQSSIRYNKSKFRDARHIEMSGEVFFDVEPGEIPFEIQSGNGRVTVLGTSFDVYSRKDVFEVTCKTGRVLVESGSGSAYLMANQRVRGAGGNLGTVEPIGTIYISSWQNGETTLIRSPLTDVFSRMEAVYGIRIEMAPTVDAADTFSGAFVHSNVDAALEMVCGPMGLTFEKSSESHYLVQ